MQLISTRQQIPHSIRLGMNAALVVLGLLLAGCNAGPNTQAELNNDAAAKSPANLTWQAPPSREDGSPLDTGEIASYRIYFKLEHQDSYQSVTVDDPHTTSLSLADFAPGTYHFAITTVDTNGLESRRSPPLRIKVTEVR